MMLPCMPSSHVHRPKVAVEIKMIRKSRTAGKKRDRGTFIDEGIDKIEMISRLDRRWIYTKLGSVAPNDCLPGPANRIRGDNRCDTPSSKHAHGERRATKTNSEKGISRGRMQSNSFCPPTFRWAPLAPAARQSVLRREEGPCPQGSSSLAAPSVPRPRSQGKQQDRAWPFAWPDRSHRQR